MLTTEPQEVANVYWIGEIQDQVNGMDKWGRYIKAQLPQARASRIGYHCTQIHNPKQDPELEKECQNIATGKSINQFTVNTNRKKQQWKHKMGISQLQ